MCFSSIASIRYDSNGEILTLIFSTVLVEFSYQTPYSKMTNPIWIDPSTGNGVNFCGNGDYCCYNDRPSGCCSTSSLVFYLGPATIHTTIGYTQASTTSLSSVSFFTTSALLSSTKSSARSHGSAASTSAIGTSSSSVRPSVLHPGSAPSAVGLGIGIGIGVPVGIAMLAGLVYLIRHRSRFSDRRDGVQVHLDNSMELDTIPRNVHNTFEVAGDSRPVELSEQGLVELQHLYRYPAVEMD